jgi:hypothetical protein
MLMTHLTLCKQQLQAKNRGAIVFARHFATTIRILYWSNRRVAAIGHGDENPRPATPARMVAGGDLA